MNQLLRLVAVIFVVFVAIWTIEIYDVKTDTSGDVDLGIATSELSISDCALWTLPLTLFITVPLFLIGVVVIAIRSECAQRQDLRQKNK